MYVHPLTLGQAQAREARRARRDAPFLAGFTPGDTGREHEREARAAVLGAALAAGGAPDPDAMATGLLRAVGATFTVPWSGDPGDLGFAAEIALAGQSALEDEPDFGAWEVKSTFGAGRIGFIRLLAWTGRRRKGWLTEQLTLRRAGVIVSRAGTVELGGGFGRIHLRDAELVWSPSREGIRRVVAAGTHACTGAERHAGSTCAAGAFPTSTGPAPAYGRRGSTERIASSSHHATRRCPGWSCEVTRRRAAAPGNGRPSPAQSDHRAPGRRAKLSRRGRAARPRASGTPGGP